jgi:cytohesin
MYKNIFDAAEKGNVDDVRFFVETKGTDTNVKDSDGWTPLFYAAKHNSNVDVLEYLISQGASVNATSNTGRTPMHVAAQGNGNVAVLECLLSHGADVNAKNKDGWTSLHEAAKHNSNVEIVKYLIAKGVPVNVKISEGVNKGDMPLHYAAGANSNVEVLKYLIDQGAEVNEKNDHGLTPLHFADTDEKRHILREAMQSGKRPQEKNTLHIQFTTEEQTEISEFCAAFGNNLNRIDDNGFTLLHLMAGAGKMGVVKFLVAEGADVNAKSNNGETPLHFAAYGGHVKVAHFLVSVKANVNAQTNKGDTPLHTAVREKNFGVITFLVAMAKVNVDVKTDKGHTPLHLAAYRGSVDITRLLISNGADVNAKENGGESLLHGAVRGGNAEVVRFLVGVPDINLNAGENNGLTPLHLAAHLGNVEIAKILVAGKADINAHADSSLDGATPLDVAKVAGQTAMVEYLSGMSAKSTQCPPSNEALDQIENVIRHAEDYIEAFRRGRVFPAQLESMLNQQVRAWHNSGCRDAVVKVFKSTQMTKHLANRVASGQPSYKSAVRLLDEPNDLDMVSNAIGEMKDFLKSIHASFPENQRISSLLERCWKCDQEIHEIRNVHLRG